MMDTSIILPVLMMISTAHIGRGSRTTTARRNIRGKTMNQIVDTKPLASAKPVALPEKALNQLFAEARTHNGFHDVDVPEQLLVKAVELARLGPTAANTSPMRVV